MLVEAGANVNAIDEHDEDAIMMILEWAEERSDKKKDEKIVKLLIQYGFDLSLLSM